MLLLTLRETYALNRLSSFKNLRQKGGKFGHRPGRPKVLLRHCITSTYLPMISYRLFCAASRYMFMGPKLPWADAVERCRAIDATLVMIQNEQDQRNLMQYLSQSDR